MGKKLNYWSKHQKQVSVKTLDKSKEWAMNSNLKKHQLEQKLKEQKKQAQIDLENKQVVPIKTKKPEITSQMFFSYNTSLGPPYRILVDTNFINFSVQNKLDIVKASMDCLFAKCDVCISDCVVGELEKLGDKFRVALKVAKDPRFIRLKCTHKGIYADDCICSRVESNPIYIVGTCDRDLRRRIRKIPGVPIMYLKNRQYYVERLPDVDQMCFEKVDYQLVFVNSFKWLLSGVLAPCNAVFSNKKSKQIMSKLPTNTSSTTKPNSFIRPPTPTSSYFAPNQMNTATVSSMPPPPSKASSTNSTFAAPTNSFKRPSTVPSIPQPIPATPSRNAPQSLSASIDAPFHSSGRPSISMNSMMAQTPSIKNKNLPPTKDASKSTQQQFTQPQPLSSKPNNPSKVLGYSELKKREELSREEAQKAKQELETLKQTLEAKIQTLEQECMETKWNMEHKEKELLTQLHEKESALQNEISRLQKELEFVKQCEQEKENLLVQYKCKIDIYSRELERAGVNPITLQSRVNQDAQRREQKEARKRQFEKEVMTTIQKLQQMHKDYEKEFSDFATLQDEILANDLFLTTLQREFTHA